jgi:hypothetical protein
MRLKAPRALCSGCLLLKGMGKWRFTKLFLCKKHIKLIKVGMSPAIDISVDTYRSEGPPPSPVRRKLVSRCSTPAGSRVPHNKAK